MTGLTKTLRPVAASMTPVTTILSRKLALAAGLVCLAAPVLSSCGFDYATDRPNVIANGGFALGQNGMRVLATRIVADTSNRGVFIATLALNPTANPAVVASRAPQLTALGTRSDSAYQMTAGSFSPIAVTDTGAVNMADPSVGGIPVTGDFKAGSMIPVTLTFSDGEKVSVQTPVVTQCHEFASVSPQAGTTHGTKGKGKNASGTATNQATSQATDSASALPTAQATDQASTAPSAEATAPYDCSFPSLPPIGE